MSTWSRSHSGFVVNGEGGGAAASGQLRECGFGSIVTLTLFCGLNHKKTQKKQTMDNYLPVKSVTNNLRSRVME